MSHTILFQGDTGSQKPAEDSAIETNNGVKLYTDDNFESATQTGHHFVKFYAPWCPHCQNMAKTWEDLANSYEDGSVSVAKVQNNFLTCSFSSMYFLQVDCTQHQAVCGSQEVRGYPSLLFFSGGKMVRTET